jgi:hypothetical protein
LLLAAHAVGMFQYVKVHTLSYAVRRISRAYGVYQRVVHIQAFIASSLTIGQTLYLRNQ